MDLRGPMAVLWGQNSQGKTSLAEALEFLLTGETVRREFVASATREFTGSLRNVYLSDQCEVRVVAEIVDSSDKARTVARELITDYTGRDACESSLSIDGVAATDLSSLGIRLSQPPLCAPILLQHTLRYVVSARPQDRTDYFKALLEVSDLEEVRSAIVAAKSELDTPITSSVVNFRRCLEKPYGTGLRALETGHLSTTAITGAITTAFGALLVDHEPIPESLEERVAVASEILKLKREKTFPVQGFVTGPKPSWSDIPDNTWAVLLRFAEVSADVEKEVARLTELFTAVLDVPSIVDATAAIDCPVCNTTSALTQERIGDIRQKVAQQKKYSAARKEAQEAFRTLKDFDDRLDTAVLRATPTFFSWNENERKECGFTDEAIRDLIGDVAEALLPQWNETSSELTEILAALKTCKEQAQTALANIDFDEFSRESVSILQSAHKNLISSANEVVSPLESQRAAQDPLVRTLNAVIDKRGQTLGWQDLIDLASDLDGLLEGLIDARVRDTVTHTVEAAIQDIDEAKGHVLDAKFTALSGEISKWWDLLRPDEPTSFSGVTRGATGRRYIDLKAKLESKLGSSVERDVVAVFSDSQLNCLGLAAFLARAIRERAGFVILDDPVPSSDEEHRAMFLHRVLKELMDNGCQVILLTHDQTMWTDVQEIYKHIDLDTFQVTLDDAAKGALIKNTGDTLDALLFRAKPYIRNADPDIRKECGAKRLREAAERLCKCMLVNKRRSDGDNTASLSDYAGLNLGKLQEKIDPLLTRDPAHPGKLRAIARHLNPGSHDDAVPSVGDLRVCFGDIETLRKKYL